MTAPTPDALRAAFAAGAQWAVNLLEAPGVSSTWAPNITTEAARRYPAPLPCPVCGRDDITVTRRGVMRSHNSRLGYWCRGTGQPPARPPAAPKEVAP